VAKPLTRKEFHSIVTEQLGLSIVGAAPYLGISKRQCQRIDSGTSPVPKPIGKLLRLVEIHQIPAEQLLDA